MTDEAVATQLELPDTSSGCINSFLVRLGLGKTAQQATVVGVLLFVALAWVVPLLLCLSSGSAFGPSLQVPFFGDYISSARFLVVVPILLLSDLVTRSWSLKTLHHFLQGNSGKKLSTARCRSNCLRASLASICLLTSMGRHCIGRALY